MRRERKLYKFIKRFRRYLSWSHNKMIVIFYTAVFIFMAQTTVSVFYACARGDFLCERVIIEEFVKDDNTLYPDFSPRLYKNSHLSDENLLTNFGDVKKDINRILLQKNKLTLSQNGIDVKQDLNTTQHADVKLKENNALPICPFMPPNLTGKIYVNTEVYYNFDLLEAKYKHLDDGGQYSPPDCQARHKIAIIVPYRNRKYHLTFFFKHIHSFLRRQQIAYRIFVVEIAPNSKFNKGLLFNAGFVEASRMADFDCYIFHDVDLLPENDFNLYRCWSHSPRHLSVAVDSLNYKLPCDCLIGGVNAMTKEQLELVNGYSNKFYGWGGEDDDLYNRIKANHMTLSRLTDDVARYKMLKHPKREPNPTRWELLKLGMKRWRRDGLNTLRYTVLNRENLKLCTYILIDYNSQDPAFKEDVFTNLNKEEKRPKRNTSVAIFIVVFSVVLIIGFVVIICQ